MRKSAKRGLDAAVVLVTVVCVSAPFLATTHASSLIQQPITVDVEVRPAATITQFGDESFFEVRPNGRSQGLLVWEVHTLADEGYKLSISSRRTPALKSDSADVTDMGPSPAAWNVTSGRRFGFTVQGADALADFSQGRAWRGFEGDRNIEVSQKKSAANSERTEVLVRSEMATPWPSGAALPKSQIVATTTVNL